MLFSVLTVSMSTVLTKSVTDRPHHLDRHLLSGICAVARLEIENVMKLLLSSGRALKQVTTYIQSIQCGRLHNVLNKPCCNCWLCLAQHHCCWLSSLIFVFSSPHLQILGSISHHAPFCVNFSHVCWVLFCLVLLCFLYSPLFLLFWPAGEHLQEQDFYCKKSVKPFDEINEPVSFKCLWMDMVHKLLLRKQCVIYLSSFSDVG